MAVLIYVVWFAGIALKGAAADRMAWNGLAKRFPLLWSYLLVCVARSIALMVLRPHPATYRMVVSATLPFALLAESAAIVSVFWVIATNYRNFRVFGSILLSGLALAGAFASWVTCFLVFPAGGAHTLRDATLLTQRYASMVMTIVLGGTLISLPRSPRIPISIHATRAAAILVLDAALGFAAAWIARVYGFEYPGGTALLPVVVGLILGVLWYIAMKPVEEAPVFERGPEGLQREEREAAIAMHRSALRFDDAGRLLARK